jgi:hypothetical protein
MFSSINAFPFVPEWSSLIPLILHGNTACHRLPHLATQRYTAPAGYQARTR